MNERDGSERPPSYDAILRAAVAEFAEHGRDGVRMEKVAERAGLNKTLVYRHFTDRETLFEAALEAVFAERFALLEDLPTDLGRLFDVWTDRFTSDDTFLTMLLREAIEQRDAEPAHADLRRRYYERQVSLIRDLQREGALPDGVAPESLFLMLMAVLVFPHALPQIAELVTGRAPGSKAFTRDWKRLFRVLVSRLSDG
jgi:AcrR family transcriptional regulator